MKNKLLALIFAIGLILIGSIVYSPQPSSQALAQQRTKIIPVGPGAHKCRFFTIRSRKR
ncbi:hypothetical protein NIES4072_10520 [Nostoc commune NIES-4072]|uniref:Uncharacterized protein n=1 Tax=Nostoc commune NIES-4072 TaxID=2005467 RepID=A0A2R5FFS0_NOSCO|nr:hypothetical protein NIES4070_16310 [Nostoc commune HK-02]GBG17396.1 hypothetical protein NIES4072_10520 [Nostoc commune NIES-4072]